MLDLKKGTKVWPVIDGGSQERGIRSGTENVAGIVGMGKACELLSQRMESDNARIFALRERLKQGIMDNVDYYLYTGHPEKRLPNIASFCFRYIEGEGILLTHAIAHGSLRMSLGRENTEAEVDEMIRILPGIIQRLREMSPLYGDAAKKGEV